MWLRSRGEQEQLKGEIEQFIPPLLILIQDLYNPCHVSMEDWEQPVSEERLVSFNKMNWNFFLISLIVSIRAHSFLQTKNKVKLLGLLF